MIKFPQICLCYINDIGNSIKPHQITQFIYYLKIFNIELWTVPVWSVGFILHSPFFYTFVWASLLFFPLLYLCATAILIFNFITMSLSQSHFALIPQLHFHVISSHCLVSIFDVSLFPLSCNASSSLASICNILFRFFWKVFSFRVNFLSLGSRVVIIFSLLIFSLKVNRTLKTKKEFWY